jgi:hypothetical protein
VGATQFGDLDILASVPFATVEDDDLVANGRKLSLVGALGLSGAQGIKHLYAEGAGDIATFWDVDALEAETQRFSKRNFFWTNTTGGAREEWFNGTSAKTLVHRLEAALGGTSIIAAGGGKVNFGFDGSLHGSARVGFTFVDGGVLLPVMTGAERDAINAGAFTPGIMLYNSTTGQMDVRGAASWLSVVANAIGGAAAGYKVARGETALDGSNPTTVATGLTSIVAAIVGLKGSVAPGVGTSLVTYTTSGADLSLYGWKPTGAGDCTLIASTGTETVGWVAIGT